MRNDRRNPIVTLGRAVLLVALGVGAYVGLEAADKALLSLRPAQAPAPGVLPTIDAPATAGDRRGAGWIAQALLRIEQRRSIAVDVVQTGWIGGRLVETHGVYRQVGAGKELRFTHRMQGSVAGNPVRLARVSTGRFLFNDVLWGDATDEDRLITRVDLRKLRGEFDSGDAAPDAGSAVPQFTPPEDTLRWGGIPALLASLNQSFDFGEAREMQLRGERVVAMVGRWNPERLRRLLGDTGGSVPTRAPHHVVVALSKESQFPLMVEYRATDDPLSAPGLADESLLRPSTRPMLKIDFLRQVFDAPIPSGEFAYEPPAGAPLRDETERELRLVRDSREGRRVAATSGDPPR